MANIARRAPGGRSALSLVFSADNLETEPKVESTRPKIPSTNLDFTCDQTALHTPDKGHLPLRYVPIFLGKHCVLTKCETFHTQNVKRFTFFPQGEKFSPW
jgi:hypothetical protein